MHRRTIVSEQSTSCVERRRFSASAPYTKSGIPVLASEAFCFCSTTWWTQKDKGLDLQKRRKQGIEKQERENISCQVSVSSNYRQIVGLSSMPIAIYEWRQILNWRRDERLSMCLPTASIFGGGHTSPAGIKKEWTCNGGSKQNTVPGKKRPNSVRTQIKHDDNNSCAVIGLPQIFWKFQQCVAILLEILQKLCKTDREPHELWATRGILVVRACVLHIRTSWY